MKAIACVIRSEKVRRFIQTNYVTHLEAAAQLYVAKIFCHLFFYNHHHHHHHHPNHTQIKEHGEHPDQEHVGRVHRRRLLLGDRLGSRLWTGGQLLLRRF